MEGYSVICYNMGEFWGHNAKWNKPVTDTHTQKHKSCVISLSEILRLVKITETEDRMIVTRGWKGEEWGVIV